MSSVRQVSGSVVGDRPRRDILFHPSDYSVTGNPRRGNPDGSSEMLYVLVDGLPMWIVIRSGYVERSPVVAPCEGCNIRSRPGEFPDAKATKAIWKAALRVALSWVEASSFDTRWRRSSMMCCSRGSSKTKRSGGCDERCYVCIVFGLRLHQR